MTTGNYRVGSPYITALDEDDGSVVALDASGYVDLGVDTYLFPLGAGDSPLESVHIQCDAAIAGVFTIETHNAPKDQGAGAVTDWDTTAAGGWVKENPSSADGNVGTVGTGWTASNLTLTKTAGVGSAMIHLGNLGSRRARLRAAITTAGKARVSGHGKK